MHARALCSRYCGIGAGDPAVCQRAGRRELPAAEAMAKIDACNGAGATKEVVALVVELTVDTGDHQADAALAFSEIMGKPGDSVGRLWLDDRSGNSFTLCQRRDGSERSAARQSSRDLCRAEDRR